MSENNVPATIDPEDNNSFNEQEAEIQALAKSRIGQTVEDPETGEQIVLTESGYQKIRSIEQSTMVQEVQRALWLFTIKTEKLFLYYDYKNFAEYAEERMGISGRKAYNYTRLAEKFAHSPVFGRIMELPITTALELARDEQFIEEVGQHATGNVDEAMKARLDDMKKKLKNQKDKAADLQNKISVDRDTYIQRERDYENKITSLEKTIDAMAGERGLDPERLKKIANKNDLMHSIQDSELKINAIMGKLQDAAEIDELRDAEVGIMVNRFLGVMENWIHSVHDAYADVLFNLSQRNQPLVSETENDSNVPD
jgi:hypothetical protein